MKSEIIICLTNKNGTFRFITKNPVTAKKYMNECNLHIEKEKTDEE